MIFIILYLQVKDAIQAHSGDLSAAEAECAMIGAEADAEEEQPQQASTVSGRGKGKGKNSEDAIMTTLQKQLQETGQQLLQLQQLEQKMQPQTPAEVFGTYVKGTLVNLPERKFKKARMDISRILEAATQDSDEEEPLQVALQSFWQGGHPRPASSSSPKSVERWQPAPQLWKSTRPPTGSLWQSQDCGYMDRYEASLANQMLPPPLGPPQFPQQQQQYLQQQQQQYSKQQQQYLQQQQSVSTAISGAHQVLTTSLDTRAVSASDGGCERGLVDMSLPHISGISGISSLLEASRASGQGSPMDVHSPTLPGAGEKQ